MIRTCKLLSISMNLINLSVSIWKIINGNLFTIGKMFITFVFVLIAMLILYPPSKVVSCLDVFIILSISYYFTIHTIFISILFCLYFWHWNWTASHII